MAEHLSSINEALGSIPSTPYSGCGSSCLVFGRLRQEDKKFKVTLVGQFFRTSNSCHRNERRPPRDSAPAQLMLPSPGVTSDRACVCGARQAPTLVSCPDTGFPVSYWWMGAWWEQRTFIGAVDTYELLASVGEEWGRGRKKRMPLPMSFQQPLSLRLREPRDSLRRLLR